MQQLKELQIEPIAGLDDSNSWFCANALFLSYKARWELDQLWILLYPWNDEYDNVYKKIHSYELRRKN